MTRVRSVNGTFAGALLLASCAAGASTSGPAPAGPAAPARQAVTAVPAAVTADDAAGPRLHVTIDGGCPASPGDAVGVRNDGPEVTDALVPALTPTGALVCEYGHAGPHRWARVRAERLDAAAATREAEQLRARPLAHHRDGAVRPRSCLPGLILPSPTRVVVLAFDGRPDVAVWDVHGCGRWTANGWVGTTS